MLENTNPREHRTGPGRERTPEIATTPSPSRQVADREVPLKRHRTPSAIHAWLDGELPETAVRRGGTVRDVEFWHRIDKEMERRRQMRTPTHVHEQIMQALPQTTPRVTTPWWRRPLSVSPVVVAGASAGLLALGVAMGATVLRQR